jgi:hypothetical protein
MSKKTETYLFQVIKKSIGLLIPPEHWRERICDNYHGISMVKCYKKYDNLKKTEQTNDFKQS